MTTHQERVQRIQRRCMRGEFLGAPGNDAVTELLAIVEEQASKFGRDAWRAELQKRIAGLRSDLDALRKAFPGPECEDCSCEMSLENHGNQDFYVCSCHEGGCTCFLSAPCSWCMHVIIADDWMLEHSSEHRIEKRSEDNQRKHVAIEQGPSAATTAKPVSPKHVIACQNYWDGIENL